MNDGGVLRSSPRASRRWRAALLLVASAGTLTACTASGSDGASASDGTTTTLAGGPPLLPQERNGDDAPMVPVEGEPVDCTSVDPTRWAAAPTETDLPTEIGAGKAPSMSGTDAVTGPPDQAVLYPTPDDFLAQSNVPDPAARKAVMEAAGYRGGIEAEWANDAGSKMQVLNFADARSAADYMVARLPNLCGQGGTQRGVTPLNGGGGITWVDPLGATHAEFIMGGSQVSLTTCGCTDEPVSIETMQAWHDAILNAYASGPAVPIS